METARTRARPRRWHLLVAVVIGAAVAVPLGIAGASHDATGIHACVRGTDGLVRIVASDAECRTGESVTQWNTQGPAGPAGPTGPTGPAGASGGTALPDPETAYLTCTSAQGDVIEGGSAAKEHDKWIEVVSYSHEVVSPRDAASGLPTGKRQHKPLVITKELDKSTPLLAKALVNNENLTSCTLDLVQMTGDGAQTYFTIELVNASIAGIEQQQAIPHADTPGAPLNRESISFTYQKIIWTWTDGGITTEDDWESSQA